MLRAHDPDSDSAARGASGDAAGCESRVRPSDPAAAAVHAALTGSSALLCGNMPAALAGDEEGVHQLRTTTRRVRTALELFRSLVDPDWSDHLADEFKWLARCLGEVRDLDVLIARLKGHAAEPEGEGPAALEPLFGELRERHRAASESLREVLRGERFGSLAGALAAAAEHVPFTDEANAPCREALPPLVAAAWKRLKRDGRDLKPDSPDEAFHEVRKRAKRARYAAEAVRRALGTSTARRAGKFARRAREVQDVLGAHQDSVVAAGVLADAACARPDDGPFNFAAGRLLELENRLAAESRDRFFEVWDDLDRRKVVHWLHG